MTNFVDGDDPICFRVSRYCRVMVVESTSPATSRIRRKRGGVALSAKFGALAFALGLQDGRLLLRLRPR